MDKSEPGVLIANRFRLGEPIGTGSHCRVYKGTAHSALDQATGQQVAIKFALAGKRNLVLKREAKIGNVLGAIKPGFARAIWYGRQGDQEIGVSELLGPSLLDHVLSSSRKLSYKTVLMLGEQLLSGLEALHGIGYLHLDLKPDNFLMGIGAKSGVVHIIDFSLSRKYVRKGSHKTAKRTEFFGNPYWASIKVLSGLSPSRQDEIEALANVFLFLLTGNLPWQHINHHNYAMKRARLLAYRKSLPSAKAFQGLPPVFSQIVAYARSLQHEESPDYCWIRAQLHSLGDSLCIAYDNLYEWDTPGTPMESNFSCLAIMQEERCLLSEGTAMSSLELKSPERPARKRANSADEPPIPIPKFLTATYMDSDSSSKKSQSPSRRMRSLAVHQRSPSPGALLGSRSSQDSAKPRTSVADSPAKKLESQAKRRASIAETEEEETDDEVMLPSLHPEVRGKISRLKVALR